MRFKIITITLIIVIMVGCDNSSVFDLPQLNQKVIDVINERNYYLNSSRYIKSPPTTHIYQNDNSYFIHLVSSGFDEILEFKLEDDEYLYKGLTQKIPTNAILLEDVINFESYDSVYNPIYNNSFDYSTVYSALRHHILAFCDDGYSTYELYVQNHFEWDYSNDYSKLLNVILIFDNNTVFSTYIYKENNKWYIGSPGYHTTVTEYEYEINATNQTKAFYASEKVN